MTGSFDDLKAALEIVGRESHAERRLIAEKRLPIEARKLALLGLAT